MEGGNRVARFELDQLAAGHEAFKAALVIFSRAEDVVFLALVIIDNLQIDGDAVQLQRDRVKIEVVVFIGNLDINGMPFQHRPSAEEVIREAAAVPIGVDVGIGAEVDHDVLFFIQIHQLAMDNGQEIDRRGRKLHESVAVFVDVHGRILELPHVVNRVGADGGRRRRSRAEDGGADARARAGGDDFRRVGGRPAGHIFLRRAGHLPENQIVVKTLDWPRRDVDVRIYAPDVGVAVIGMIAGKALPARAVGAVDPIEHAVVQGREQRVGGRWHEVSGVLRQLSDIHHVVVAFFTGVAAVVFRDGRAAGELREELPRILRGGLQRFDAIRAVSGHQIRSFRDVGNGKGGDFLGGVAVRNAALVIGIADHFAEPRAAHGGIVRQCAEPAGIVPAAARLTFLRGHHISGETMQRGKAVHRRHQAGIETDDLKGRNVGIRAVDRIESVMDLIEAHHVAGALVVANAADTAAAVVPENEDTVVGGEVVPAEAQEVRETASRPHVRIGRWP